MPYFATASAFSMYDDDLSLPNMQRRSARYLDVMFSVLPNTFNRVMMLDDETLSRLMEYKPLPLPYSRVKGKTLPTFS